MVAHLPPFLQGQSGVGEGVGELVTATKDVVMTLLVLVGVTLVGLGVMESGKVKAVGKLV